MTELLPATYYGEGLYGEVLLDGADELAQDLQAGQLIVDYQDCCHIFNLKSQKLLLYAGRLGSG